MAFSLSMPSQCACLQCPPQLDTGPSHWCYLTSRWRLVIPGEPTGSIPTPSRSLTNLIQPRQSGKTEPSSNGEMQKGDTVPEVSSFGLSLHRIYLIYKLFTLYGSYDLTSVHVLKDLLCRMQGMS